MTTIDLIDSDIKLNVFDVFNNYDVLIYSHLKHVFHTVNRAQFIIDFDATTHICCEKAYFIEIKPTSVKISWGKISQINAFDIDDVPIIFHDTNTKAVLKNCLFVPEFDINLISVSILLKNNYKIIFDTKCKIFSSKNTLVSQASSCNGLYIFPVISNTHVIYSSIARSKSAKDEINTWHARMSHVDKKALMKLKFQNHENIIRDNEIDLVCEECILAKATKHINHEISENSTKEFLQLVRSDLFGPVQTPSFSNKRYFITFLDDFTKYLVVEILNTKDEATKTFCDFAIREQRFSNKKIKVYRTNNDTKFLKIKEICIKNDIIHENIASYAHEQAESVERINLTLLNKIRAMLITAKLDKRFWVEALLVVVYLYNRTSHTSLNFKISFEIKYNIKSKINNIKI